MSVVVSFAANISSTFTPAFTQEKSPMSATGKFLNWYYFTNGNLDNSSLKFLIITKVVKQELFLQQ